MGCFQEKEVRILFTFLTACLLLGAAADWGIYGRAEGEMAHMAARQAGMAASALLESGMSPVEVGEILSSDRITPEGTALVERIGRDADGQILLSAFASRQRPL